MLNVVVQIARQWRPHQPKINRQHGGGNRAEQEQHIAHVERSGYQQPAEYHPREHRDGNVAERDEGWFVAGAAEPGTQP